MHQNPGGAEPNSVEDALRLAMVVVQHSPVVLVRWRGGDEWLVEYVSESVRQFGYAPEDFTSGAVHYDDIILPEDLPRVRRECRDAAEAGIRQFAQEYRIRTRDGRVRWMEDRTTVGETPDRDDYEGILLDITERRVAEEGRRELEGRLRLMLDSVQMIALVLDRQARITFCNRFAESLGGWTRDELLGSECFERFAPPSVRDRLRIGFERAMETGVFTGQLEEPIVTKAGTVRQVAWDLTVLRDVAGQVIGAAVFGRDITEQRQLEAQFRHAQKMDAIGQLAGGVAHDFNNLLQVITGYTSLAIGEVTPEDRLYPELLEIQRATQRATALVGQLLAFSRRHKIERRPVALNDVVGNLLKMLRRLIGEHIELEFAPGRELQSVMADVGLVEQVLMNLCVNARDAMPDGGRIVISTANLTLGRDFVRQRGWGHGGEFVLLSVRDSGPGIPEGLHDRIFEPFFTTKGVGKGSGLGLATVYGIVKQHDGMIEVARDGGPGAEFRIYLPVAVAVPDRRQDDSAQAAAAGGHETILLAEDEDVVRSLAKRVLETAGYRVLLAKDGEEAIAQIDARAGEIDLALLDVVMPKGSGREVGARLKLVRPDVPVLFSSGYSRQALDETWMPDEGAELILKPYEPKALLRRVRETLEKHRRI